MFEEIGTTAEGDLIINVGPQHPATHGVLHLVITLNGETIKKWNRIWVIFTVLLKKCVRALPTASLFMLPAGWIICPPTSITMPVPFVWKRDCRWKYRSARKLSAYYG